LSDVMTQVDRSAGIIDGVEEQKRLERKGLIEGVTRVKLNVGAGDLESSVIGSIIYD